MDGFQNPSPRNGPMSPRDVLKGMEQPGHEEAAVDLPEDIAESKKWLSFRLLWAYTGPGWLMSIAYLDPGNLESDLQAGAYGGYQLLWVLFWSTGLGLFLQVLAARLGVVTGDTLAQHCRTEYPRAVSIILWLNVELAIVASDIQEVLGSAIAINVLSNGTIPMWAGCLITGADTFTFLGLHVFGVRKLEAFFALLIGIMLVCFGADFAFGHPAGLKIARGIAVPELDQYAVEQAVGILGAVVMPHNLYLHSALVQSRKVDRSQRWRVKEACKYNALESAGALLVSFIINAMVLAVFAQQFFAPQCQVHCGDDTGCQCWIPDAQGGHCGAIGLREAGDALKDVLGSNGARVIWAVGLLAAGQASTMTGTYAGQFVMEGFLNLKVAAWKRVALTRSLALLPSIAVALSAQDPHFADSIDEWLNVLQSVQLPFAILPLLHFTSSKKIMGSFSNNTVVEVFAWSTSLLVMAINFYLVYQTTSDLLPNAVWVYLLVAVYALLYFTFNVNLIKTDIRRIFNRIRNCRSAPADEEEPLEISLIQGGAINQRGL